MTNTILLLLIGAFIGWAKWIQAKALGLFTKIKAKFNKES